MTTVMTAPASTRYRFAAALSIVAAVALDALGLWGDGTPGKDTSGNLSEFLVVCGIIAAECRRSPGPDRPAWPGWSCRSSACW